MMRLHREIDVARYASQFRRRGRVIVEPFLALESAERLRQHLSRDAEWRRVFNAGEKVYEVSRTDWSAMAAEDRDRLLLALNKEAQQGFQYRLETIRVDDDPAARAARGSELDAFAALMCEPATLEMMRRITGTRDITFADAQGTAYHPGDFLTGHDDDVAGKQRRAAYVLGLCPAWRLEWGGLLLFDRGVELDGMVPGFNRLTLFSVPRRHSVSLIAPFAATPRYAVTGWLRAIDRS